jgi:hypothetical protein
MRHLKLQPKCVGFTIIIFVVDFNSCNPSVKFLMVNLRSGNINTIGSHINEYRNVIGNFWNEYHYHIASQYYYTYSIQTCILRIFFL